jgi:Fic family protein
MAVMNRERIKLFIRESNAVERVYSELAFDQALKAFRYLKKYDVLTLKNILQCHKILMKKLDKKVAGTLRTYAVRVGNDLKMNHERVEEELVAWIKYASPSTNLKYFKDFKSIKAQHIDFEHIHPFGDGNGRIGRILMLWQGIKAGIRIPVIYENTKHHYDKWFINKEKVYNDLIKLFNLDK